MLDPNRNEITEGAIILSARELSHFDRTRCQLCHDRDGSKVLADFVVALDNWPKPVAVCSDDSELFVWNENTQYDQG